MLDIYQAKIGLFTWFHLQVCNQRYKRLLLYSVIHSFTHSLPLKGTVMFHPKFVDWPKLVTRLIPSAASGQC